VSSLRWLALLRCLIFLKAFCHLQLGYWDTFPILFASLPDPPQLNHLPIKAYIQSFTELKLLRMEHFWFPHSYTIVSSFATFIALGLVYVRPSPSHSPHRRGLPVNVSGYIFNRTRSDHDPSIFLDFRCLHLSNMLPPIIDISGPPFGQDK
jgi:hypothetical protein